MDRGVQAVPVSSLDPSAGSASRLPVPTPTRDMTDAGTADSPLRSVREQLLDSLQAPAVQGDKQIVIRLQPPEMGTVIVRFREQGGHLDGTVEVGPSHTRREIEQALPEVIRHLQEAGIPLRRLEVTTHDSPEPGFGRGSSQPETWSGPQDGGQRAPDQGQNTEHRGQRTQDRRPPSSELRGADPDPQSYTAQGRIDVLL